MQKTKLPAVISTFVICYLFWLLLTWSVAAEQLIAGAVASLLAALFSARFFIHERAFWFFNPLKLLAGVFFWLGTFMAELVKANWDMAKRCYGGCKNVDPGIVKVPSELKSDYGQAGLANAITMTPGTITMEIAEEDGQVYYYIHWIDAKCDGAEAGEIIKGRLEKGLRRVWE